MLSHFHIKSVKGTFPMRIIFSVKFVYFILGNIELFPPPKFFSTVNIHVQCSLDLC